MGNQSSVLVVVFVCALKTNRRPCTTDAPTVPMAAASADRSSATEEFVRPPQRRRQQQRPHRMWRRLPSDDARQWGRRPNDGAHRCRPAAQMATEHLRRPHCWTRIRTGRPVSDPLRTKQPSRLSAWTNGRFSRLLAHDGWICWSWSWSTSRPLAVATAAGLVPRESRAPGRISPVRWRRPAPRRSADTLLTDCRAAMLAPWPSSR